MKAYIAHAMTGRSGEEMHAESEMARAVLSVFGIETLDPVYAEGVDRGERQLTNSLEDLKVYWARDKQLIREAHVLIDLTPGMKSEGVSHEIGYARYFLWKPVIRVGNAFPLASVAHFEDDAIVSDLWDAGLTIDRLWGTLRKRIVWRMRMYKRCLFRAWRYKMGEWK